MPGGMSQKEAVYWVLVSVFYSLITVVALVAVGLYDFQLDHLPDAIKLILFLLFVVIPITPACWVAVASLFDTQH